MAFVAASKGESPSLVKEASNDACLAAIAVSAAISIAAVANSTPVDLINCWLNVFDVRLKTYQY